MTFAATSIFVDDVPATLEFYRKAFGLETRFYDAEYEYAELETGGPAIAVASHRLGERLMPGVYVRTEAGQASWIEIGFYANDVPVAFAKAVAAGTCPTDALRARNPLPNE